MTPRKMKEVISYFFHKNADLASIASVGAAVGIGILFVFALHRWSVPSLAQEPVPRRVWEYGEELGIYLPNSNVDSSNANRYLEEIAHVLEFLFFDQQAIESLPGGALLGGACEDCNFKDDQSGFDRYRHSRLRLLHINGEGAIQ